MKNRGLLRWEGLGEGRPPRGHRCRRRGARGGGGGGEAPKDFTKPRQTIQSPNRLYKAPETLHKHINIRQKPLNIRQVPKILNKSSNN